MTPSINKIDTKMNTIGLIQMKIIIKAGGEMNRLIGEEMKMTKDSPKNGGGTAEINGQIGGPQEIMTGEECPMLRVQGT